MEEKLFNELKETNWFDCDEDINDFISEVIDSLKEGKIDKAIDEAMGWIDYVYDNLHKDIEFDIPETKKFLKNLFTFVYEFKSMNEKEENIATKDRILDLLLDYNVDKAYVIENIFNKYEINDLIAERMVERKWELKEVKDFFGIEE